jgi:hypothetical protein
VSDFLHTVVVYTFTSPCLIMLLTSVWVLAPASASPYHPVGFLLLSPGMANPAPLYRMRDPLLKEEVRHFSRHEPRFDHGSRLHCHLHEGELGSISLDLLESP